MAKPYLGLVLGWVGIEGILNPTICRVEPREGLFNMKLSPRGSKYLIIKELGLEDHDYYGFWGLSPESLGSGCYYSEGPSPLKSFFKGDIDICIGVDVCRCDRGSLSTRYLRTLVPRTMPLMAFGTRILRYWPLGPSGLRKPK